MLPRENFRNVGLPGLHFTRFPGGERECIEYLKEKDNRKRLIF